MQGKKKDSKHPQYDRPIWGLLVDFAFLANEIDE
jgi:hypothetical protein